MKNDNLLGMLPTPILFHILTFLSDMGRSNFDILSKESNKKSAADKTYYINRLYEKYGIDKALFIKLSDNINYKDLYIAISKAILLGYQSH